MTHSLSVVFFSRTYLGGVGGVGGKNNNDHRNKSESKDGKETTRDDNDNNNHKSGISTIQTDVDGRMFVDHYKPIIENETRSDWESLIHRIKKEFIKYPRSLNWNISLDGFGRSSSRIPSVASQGNLLEAINTTLNVLQFHFMDRDLSRTGNSIVVVTAGAGVFEVDKSLATITKQRMMDNGIGSDCISLSLPPLHVTPFFMYKMTDEDSKDRNENVEEMLHDWKKYFESPHWLNVCFVGYKENGNNENDNSDGIGNNDTDVERNFREVLAAIQPTPRTLPTPLLCLMGMQTSNLYSTEGIVNFNLNISDDDTKNRNRSNTSLHKSVHNNDNNVNKRRKEPVDVVKFHQINNSSDYDSREM